MATLQRQYTALERKAARLTQRRRSQAAADRKERTRLAEELATAQGQLQLMHERIGVFTAENPALAEENARRYANVMWEEHRRRMAELREAMDDNLAEITGREPASSVSMRDLQKRFHPDKWSNGQSAVDMGTELMKFLNT